MQVRTDLLDLAVWREVCTLLAYPERLAEEYRRRLQPAGSANGTSLATLEGQIAQLKHGIARLIDSYADGLIDKTEFEPRITRVRQRIARLEEQRRQFADEAALQADLQLIIGRVEDFAAKVHNGLEVADGASQRELIRALVKRVEVGRHEVNIVFRIDPYIGDLDPEKKSLQLCRGSIESLAFQSVRAPVRAQRYCSVDATMNGWEFMSSLGRQPRSSPRLMGSFQRTTRPVSGTPTRKKQACRMRPEGQAGYGRRRDVTNGEHIVSGGKTMWKTVAWPEGDGPGQTRGRRLCRTTHTPDDIGLQARIRGHALGSLPALVRVPLQRPGTRPLSSWPARRTPG